MHADDDRRRALVDRLEHLAEPARVLDVLLVAQVDRRAHPLDVGAGAEALAVAREHDRARVADVGERLAQLGDQRGVERVAPLGPRERHAQERPVAFDPECVSWPRSVDCPRAEGCARRRADAAPRRRAPRSTRTPSRRTASSSRGGLDGVLALGTTGEGILLSPRSGARASSSSSPAGLTRRRPLRRADDRGDGRARRARGRRRRRRRRRDRAAVLPARRRRAARALRRGRRACAPTPFYVYEFARASGYAVPLEVLERLARAGAEPRGLKVSDPPWDAFAPYLLEGLDVFVGPEALIAQGMRANAVGAVSALASAFPASASRRPSATPRRGGEGHRRPARRDRALPRHAALKHVVARKGVPMREDVRAPLRAAARTTSERSSTGGSNRHSRRGRDRRLDRVPPRRARREGRRARRRRRGRVGRNREGDGRRSAAVLDRRGGRLAQESIRFFESLGPPFFDQVGYLFVATTEEGWRRSRSAAPSRRARRSAERVDAGARRGAERRRRARRRRLLERRRADPPAVARELVRRASRLGVSSCGSGPTRSTWTATCS